jgi:hypothetical protein
MPLFPQKSDVACADSGPLPAAANSYKTKISSETVAVKYPDAFMDFLVTSCIEVID